MAPVLVPRYGCHQTGVGLCDPESPCQGSALIVATAQAGKLEYVRPPTPNKRGKDNRCKASYMNAPTFRSPL